MTYVVAWKNETTAFVVADAAMTSPYSPKRAFSTFGEKHKAFPFPFRASPDEERFVEESALKIFAFDHCIFSFSGNVDVGVEAANVFRASLADGRDPFTCLTLAGNGRTSVSIIVVYCDDTGPHLIHYAGKHYCENNSPCQIGSAPQHVQDATREFITGRLRHTVKGLSKVLIHPDALPMVELVSVMGRLQSFGIHEDLIHYGIGGTFTGAFVNQDGVSWQPDILYLRHRHDSEKLQPVVAGVRSDSLITRYVAENGTVCSCGFNQQRPDESLEIARQRMADARYAMRDVTESALLDYVVFLSEEIPGNASLIEMAKHLRHKMVEFDLSNPQSPVLRLHNELWELVNRHNAALFLSVRGPFGQWREQCSGCPNTAVIWLMNQARSEQFYKSARHRRPGLFGSAWALLPKDQQPLAISDEMPVYDAVDRMDRQQLFATAG